MATGQFPNTGRFVRRQSPANGALRYKRRLRPLRSASLGQEQYGSSAQTANRLAIDYFWGVASPGGTVNGTAAGSVTVAGSANGTVTQAVTTGTAAGSVTVAGTANGTVTQGVTSGTAAGSVSVAGAANGTVTQAVTTGTASGAVTVSGSATGTVVQAVTSGTAAGSVDVAGAATGTATQGVTSGTATGAVTVSGAANGAVTQAVTSGTAAGSVSVVGRITVVDPLALLEVDMASYAHITGLQRNQRRAELLRAAQLSGLDARVVDIEAAIQEVAAAYVAAAQATSSASYTDLATVGPAVTLTTGATALVRLSSLVNNSVSGNTCFIGVAVSGATTIAASDAKAVIHFDDNISNSDGMSGEVLVTGLTPGSNTFTAKYRVNGGTGTWTDRTISVTAL